MAACHCDRCGARWRTDRYLLEKFGFGLICPECDAPRLLVVTGGDTYPATAGPGGGEIEGVPGAPEQMRFRKVLRTTQGAGNLLVEQEWIEEYPEKPGDWESGMVLPGVQDTGGGGASRAF